MIKFSELREGQILWTTSNSIESAPGGISCTPPRRPRKVKVIRKESGWWFYSFDEEAGVIDDDSNASNLASEDGLFATEREASVGYSESVIVYAESLRAEADELMNGCIDVSELVG